MDGWIDGWVDGWMDGWMAELTVRNYRLVPIFTWHRVHWKVAGLPSASLGLNPCGGSGRELTTGSMNAIGDGWTDGCCVYTLRILCLNAVFVYFRQCSDCTGNILKFAIVFDGGEGQSAGKNFLAVSDLPSWKYNGHFE